jgi:ADP-ribosylglycohydrolase
MGAAADAVGDSLYTSGSWNMVPCLVIVFEIHFNSVVFQEVIVMIQDRIAGCLFGLALGDALAAPTEFIRDVKEIQQRFGPNGPSAPSGRVTDDTQMTLAVGEALMQVTPPYTADKVEGPLRRSFVEWMDSPENTRAPGFTCISACRRLKEGGFWWDATVIGSKGCGANMRVAPVGLLTGTDAATRAGLAQFQAALTHGHPTGLAASDLTAFTITDLLSGGDLPGLPDRLYAYAESQRTVYHTDWLGPLYQARPDTTPEAFIADGWDECLDVLARLKAAVAYGDRETDPCQLTGEGWVAEQAFGTGLLCFLLFQDNPVAALRRAAVTSGDSDSIACLTGAFAGAYHGIGAWPEDWVRDVEYRDRLQNLADNLSG